MTRALPLSPLATTDPIDGRGITSFPPDLDSGTSLVTKSYILLCIKFNRGKFKLIFFSGMSVKEKIFISLVLL